MGLKERVVLPLAKRWIAGVNIESAAADAKRANSRGFGAILNYLGEDIKDPGEADASSEEYLRLQGEISGKKIDGFVSVKLTQLGLGADDSGMKARLERIASKADSLDQLLWIDMEGSAFTDATLSTYYDLLKRHRRAGVALQAYARRSMSDLEKILAAGGTVRLVKGAYRESPSFAFQSKTEVNENYAKLTKVLFERGERFAIATHDSNLVDLAKSLAKSRRVEFRFEFLKGIRDELKVDLVKSGFRVCEYLPYGERWWPYSKRRISEHPSNFWLLLRSLV